MPNLPISQLPTGSVATANQVLPIVQGTSTNQITTTNLGQGIFDLNLPLTSSGIILSGDVLPSTFRGVSLGSLAYPFKEIFVSSGSLNIVGDTPSDPTTTISNTQGNLVLSAGGMLLLGSGSFIATTGSFQYLSGSLYRVGDDTHLGNFSQTGSMFITGSIVLNGCNVLTECQTGSFLSTGSLGHYGAFYSTTTQTNPVADVSHSISFLLTEHSNGVIVVSGSRLTVTYPGAYNIQFSAQFEKTDNGTDTVYIWIKKNGTNVPNSAGAINITKIAGGVGRAVAAWNYIDVLTANEYVEIIWQSSDTKMQLLTYPASGNIPQIPSVIATISQVG